MKKLTIDLDKDRNVLFQSFRYPAGEIQTRLTRKGLEACKYADTYEILTHSVPDVVELAQLADALNAAQNFYERSIFLAYMPYSRADRRFVEGDSHGLSVFLQLLKTMHFTSIWTFDVHNEAATDTIAEMHRLKIVNMKPTDGPVDQIKSCLVRMKWTSDNPMLEIALISPDEGAKQRYDLSKYGLPILVGGKKRDPKSGALHGFNIDKAVKDFDAALIVDDICDGGGTFIGLAEEIKKINPNILLGLYVSHGIFSKGLEPLREKFNWVFASDYTFRKEGQEPGGHFVTGKEDSPVTK